MLVHTGLGLTMSMVEVDNSSINVPFFCTVQVNERGGVLFAASVLFSAEVAIYDRYSHIINSFRIILGNCRAKRQRGHVGREPSLRLEMSSIGAGGSEISSLEQ